MKIAIISDSHDNLPNIYKAIEYLGKQNIEHMIHCGDVCAPAVLREFGEKFKGEIHVCFGNVDGDQKKDREIAAGLSNITIHGDQGEVELDGLKLGFIHYPDKAREMAQDSGEENFDFVFYGHDHKAWEEKVGQTTLLNPGTLAGLFAKPTFAILDTENKTAEMIMVEKLWAKEK